MGVGNFINKEFVRQETPATTNTGDRAESMFTTLRELQKGDRTGKLGLLKDPKSKDLESRMVEGFRTESNELLDKAKKAKVELTDLYPSLNADVLLLLGAFYSVDPSKLGKKMYIYRVVWKDGIDGRVPAAGGTAEDLKIVRGMLVGDEGKKEWSQQKPGLYLRGKERDTQRTEGDQMITNFNQRNDQGLNQAWFDPAAYVIINAQRRSRGEPQLDAETFTRFLGMADVSAGDAVWSPDAGWSAAAWTSTGRTATRSRTLAFVSRWGKILSGLMTRFLLPLLMIRNWKIRKICDKIVLAF